MNTKFSRRAIAMAITEKLIAEPQKRKHWMEVLAAFMIEQRMDDEVELMLHDIARELFARAGHLYVRVTSARELSDGLREDLKKTLRAATNATHIELAESVDKELLGGLIARTPDAELDASVRSALRQLATI